MLDQRPESPIRILVADDSPIFREALAGMLAAEPGFEVVAAVSGVAAALRSSETLAPDIAIVDMRSPGDGTAAITGICAVSPETQVIVLSGYDDHSLRASAAAAGASAFLVKGVHPAVVAGTVRDVRRAA
jgi:DNA-binding NarL/FixJ family response regulator